LGLQNRYLPSHPAGSTATFALDFSNILPPGVGIQSGALAIQKNTVPPSAIAPGEWTLTNITVEGRRIYATLFGGLAGTDYRLNWGAVDTVGGNWLRTVLLLCAQTS